MLLGCMLQPHTQSKKLYTMQSHIVGKVETHYSGVHKHLYILGWLSLGHANPGT